MDANLSTPGYTVTFPLKVDICQPAGNTTHMNGKKIFTEIVYWMCLSEQDKCFYLPGYIR